jgi:hypothetical protein
MNYSTRQLSVATLILFSCYKVMNNPSHRKVVKLIKQ